MDQPFYVRCCSSGYDAALNVSKRTGDNHLSFFRYVINWYETSNKKGALAINTDAGIWYLHHSCKKDRKKIFSLVNKMHQSYPPERQDYIDLIMTVMEYPYTGTDSQE
jgi:hypothetical protein